uniref:peptidyl-tRNA hydrolase n=1 Tax=Meloidogyne incognita TaxID=6306 RepID=A0A914N4G9_MELIC
MSTQSERLIMYLILRADLISDLKWPLGAVFTQIAHAATACIWTFKDDPEVKEYMGNMENMHKVTLKVKDEPELLEQAKKLADAGIQHKIWNEDGMAVCIAIKPQQRQKMKQFIGNLALYK